MSKPDKHMALLRQLREELGISQKKLGAITGFHGPEISQWELGKRSIKLWQFEVLLNGLGYRLSWTPYSKQEE